MSNNDDDFVTNDAPGDSSSSQRDDSRREERTRESRDSRDERDNDRDRDERSSRRSRDDRDEDDKDGPRKFTIADLGRSVSVRPTAGGLSDAALQALQTQFDKNKAFDKPSVPDAIKRNKFQLIPFDGSLARSSLSSLLMTLPVVVADKQLILVYILTVDSIDGPMTRQQTDRGDTFDAIILPQDQLATKYYKDAVREQVQGVLKGAKPVIIGSQTILASTLSNIRSDDTNPTVEKIFDNAIDALCGYRENVIDKQAGTRDATHRLNPKMMARGSRLEATWATDGRPGVDSSGLPIRSDVCATLYYSESSRDDDERYDRTPIGELRAGLDLVYTGRTRSDKDGGFNSRRRRDNDDADPFFQPVLNITSLVSFLPFSLENAQLLIAQIAPQTNEYRWATPLRPRAAIASTVGSTMPTISHIENLMLLHPTDPCVADDITANMPDEELADYLEMTVKETLAIGMTIPSTSERAWVLSIFEKIATSESRDEQDRLIKTLYDSADVLTGNRFRRALRDIAGNVDVVPVKTTGTRQFIGTWVDDKGNVRSLSEWNTLAMLTALGERGIDKVRDFQYTFIDDRRSLEWNLAERYRLMLPTVPGIHLVDTAEMLVLNPDYVEALSVALEESGMASQQTMQDGISQRRDTGNTRYGDFATKDIGRERSRGRDRDRRGGRGGSVFDRDLEY
jgi:hypothetical protein